MPWARWVQGRRRQHRTTVGKRTRRRAWPSALEIKARQVPHPFVATTAATATNESNARAGGGGRGRRMLVLRLVAGRGRGGMPAAQHILGGSGLRGQPQFKLHRIHTRFGPGGVVGHESAAVGHAVLSKMHAFDQKN